MRSFSNITLKFANKLHLLVDSLRGLQYEQQEQKSGTFLLLLLSFYYFCNQSLSFNDKKKANH